MNFKKLFTIIPIIALVLLCGSAKDIHDSFDRYYVVVAVKDTTSLNTSYEKPIVRMLRNAGHTVRLAYGDSLTKDNAIGTQDWDTFDLAVIPNFVSCPAVDTTKKIGDIPVIVLEDSLWDDFGFIPSSGASEPYLWIADYNNKRVVKTQWDGNNWSSFSTGNRYPFSISLYKGAAGVDTSIYYLSFYRASTACDTLFRTTWNFGSTSKFGSTGSSAFKFNQPRQVSSVRYASADWVVVADRVNNRYVLTKWQATDSLNYWKPYNSGGAIYGAGANGTDIFDMGAGNSKLFKNMVVGSPDSIIVGTTEGYLHITNDNIFLTNNLAGANAKIWKLDHDLTRVDSLTGSKLGIPKAVWYDTISTYIYWLDNTGKLKRAKFDGTADGSDLDSCFTSGSGVSQLSTPYGLEGYSIGGATLGTITNDDTVYVSTIDDSITSVFTSGYNKIYTSNGDMSGILTDSLDSWNILVKDKSNTYATVVIDTINNQKRIAFGLYDVSKLNMYNNYYGDHAYKSKTLPTGWELFSRSIGRLVEAEKDSIFTVGMLTEGIFYYNLATTTQDSCLNTYFQTNMHRFIPTLSYYGDSSFYNADGYGWETLDLAIVSIESYDYSVTEMKSVLEANNRPLLVLGPGSSNYFFDVTRHNVGGITSITKDSVTSSNAIFDSLGIAVGDSLGLYTTTYPVIPDLGVVTSFTINDNSTVYSPLRVKRNGTYVNIMLISKEAYWVNITSPAAAYNFSLLNFSPIYKDIFEETIYYLLSSKAILPPSNVTATTLSSNSIIVTWTDNSDNETGFNIYLTTGGSYTGEDILVSTVLENATSDTICGLYPPSGLFYLDVGATSTIGGARSGSPDSAYTLPIQPARPIVYALSDTSINVLLNGYLWYDLFNDTTLASNPQWYQPYGKWNVERGYNRLRSWNVLDSTTLNVDLDSNNLTFDGVDDYAYHADTDSLDVGTEDYLISFWFKRATFGTQQRIINKRNGTTFFDAMFDTDNKLYFTLCDGTFPAHYGVVGSSTIFNDGEWHHCIGIMDRNSSGYIFTDSTYDNSSSISTGNYDVSNTGSFYLSTYDGSIQFFNGQLSDLRFMKFGTSGLTVTGTYGTNDLLITVGVDTVYCQTTGDGLVKYLYDNPTETLNQTDYHWLYNAQQTPVSTNGTNWTDSNSDGLADNYRYENGLESGLAPTLQIGNGTHGFSGRYQRLIATGNGRYGMDLTAPFFPDSTYYYISFKYRATKSIDVAYKTFPANTEVPSSVYHVCKGALNSNLYVAWGENYVVGDSLEIDDLVIRKVGEVGWWPLTETGYPDTLYDYTSNNLDLVTSGDLVASSGISAARANVISSNLQKEIGSFGTQILLNNDFEQWTTATNATNWTEAVPGGGVITKDSTYKVSGSYSIKLNVTSGNGIDDLFAYQDITGMDTTSYYSFSGYVYYPVKTATGANIYLKISNTGFGQTTAPIYTFATNTEWTYYSINVKAPSSTTRITVGMDNETTIGTAYFDKIEVKKVNLKDVEYSLKFHLNDSLRLDKQWVKFYFISNDSIGADNGYYVYADSNDFEVRKQTNGLDISTLVDTDYTGNYKWRTLKIVQDFSCTPVDTTYTYSFYLDNNLMGTMTDSTYTTLNWWVMQSSHRRQWWDSVWLKNNSPGGNDETFTEYAITDSTSGEYLQTNHTMGSTPVWKSYESWGGEDGYYIKMSPFSTKKIRVIARPKQ